MDQASTSPQISKEATCTVSTNAKRAQYTTSFFKTMWTHMGITFGSTFKWGQHKQQNISLLSSISADRLNFSKICLLIAHLVAPMKEKLASIAFKVSLGIARLKKTITLFSFNMILAKESQYTFLLILPIATLNLWDSSSKYNRSCWQKQQLLYRLLPNLS